MAKIPRYEQKEQWNPLGAPVIPMSLADTGAPEALDQLSRASFGVADKERRAQDKLDFDSFQTDFTRDLEQSKIDALDKKPADRSAYVENRANQLKSDWLDKYSDGNSSMDAWNKMSSYADHHSMVAVSKSKLDARIALSDALQAGSNTRHDHITLQGATTGILPSASLDAHNKEEITSRDSLKDVVMDEPAYTAHIESKRRALAGVHHGRIFSKGIIGEKTGDPILSNANAIRAALKGEIDIAQQVKHVYPNKTEAERKDLVKLYEEILVTTAGGVKDNQTVLNAFNNDVLSQASAARSASELEAHKEGIDFLIDFQNDINIALQDGTPNRPVTLERLNEFYVFAKKMGKSGDRKMAFAQKLWRDFRKPRDETFEEAKKIGEIKLNILKYMSNSPPHVILEYIQSQVFSDTERDKGDDGKFSVPVKSYLKLVDEVTTNSGGSGGVAPPRYRNSGQPNPNIASWGPSLEGVLAGEMLYKIGDKGQFGEKSAADADLYYGMKSYIAKFVEEQSYAKNHMSQVEAENHIKSLVRGKELHTFTKNLATGAVMTVPVDQLKKLFERKNKGEELSSAQEQLLSITATRMSERLRKFNLDVGIRGLITAGLANTLQKKEGDLSSLKAQMRKDGRPESEIRTNTTIMRLGVARSIVADLKLKSTVDPYDLRLIRELLKDGDGSLRSYINEYNEGLKTNLDVSKTTELRNQGVVPKSKPITSIPPGEMKDTPKTISPNKIEGKGIYKRITDMAFEKYRDLSYPKSKKPGGNWMHETISEMVGGISSDEFREDYLGMSDKEFQKKYGEYQ